MHQTSDFWSGFLLKLDRHYDLSQVKQYLLGADGAHWAKERLEYLTPVLFQLDRHPLYQAIARATPPLPRWTSLFQQATTGDLAGVLAKLEDLQGKTQGEEKKERISQLMMYLRDNADGLVDYRLRFSLSEEERRKLPTLGTVEGNIDKILAHRFKRKEMSWSKKGAHGLAKILVLQSNGELVDWMRRRQTRRLLPPEIQQQAQDHLHELRKRKSGEVLIYGLSALTGPHASRSWVQVLRNLTSLQGISS